MNSKLPRFICSINWILNNSVNGKGIVVTSKQRVIYPEVTGYFIPSLLQWGMKSLAISFAQHLCSIQKSDGSWYDSTDTAPYVFDTAQIIKGLISIREIIPEVDIHIIKGCDWLLSNMQEDGRLTTPIKDAWGKNEDFCSELVHIYALSPIREAGTIFDKQEYLDAVNRILDYYKKEKIEKIKNFSLLSHFYAYVMEGLYDLGEIDLCRESMERLEAFRNEKNGIPGLKNVSWVCSTGMFQLAVVWYKLGDLDKGNSLFYYALSLQNETGGWYGSYPYSNNLELGKNDKPYYFPDQEISWAVKFFLDALTLKEKLEFERQSSTFLDYIDESDGRYVLIKNTIETIKKEKKTNESLNICDVGCGKGRYLKRLLINCPNNNYYACDISDKVMQCLDSSVEKHVCSMTNVCYKENSFDFVYACESFEHAINLETAFNELYRITKSKGKIVIIDKPIEKLGQLELYEWVQWISDDDMKKFANDNNCVLEIVSSVPYEHKNDGLFRAWVFSKI